MEQGVTMGLSAGLMQYDFSEVCNYFFGLKRSSEAIMFALARVSVCRIAAVWGEVAVCQVL